MMGEKEGSRPLLAGGERGGRVDCSAAMRARAASRDAGVGSVSMSVRARGGKKLGRSRRGGKK